jgi:hypothetical protein
MKETIKVNIQIVIILLALISAIPASAFWVDLGSCPFGTTCGTLTTDDNAMYAAVWDEGMYKSTNGGSSWTKLPIDYSWDIVADSTGALYTIGGSSRRWLMKSIDGGNNWTQTASMPNTVLGWTPVAQTLLIGSGDVVYAGGYLFHYDDYYPYWHYSSRLFRSSNGGDSWTASADFEDNSQRVYVLLETDSGALIAGTLNGEAYRSTNQGINWTRTLLTAGYVSYLAKDSLGGIYAATTSSEGFYKSVDDGANWFNLTIPGVGSYFYGMAGDSAGAIYVAIYLVADSSFHILRTSDGGATWDDTGRLEGVISYSPREVFIGPDGDMFVFSPTSTPNVSHLFKFCDGCYVGGVCYAEDEINPANPCEVCDTEYSSINWENRNGLACDDQIFCNGDDTCVANACTTHVGNPCADDGLWCNGLQICDEGDDQCHIINIPDCPDDGLWCNGDEFCDDVADQCGHTGTPCPDDGILCNGDEGCDDNTDECTHTGDPCLPDAVFCNGVEVCDVGTDQCISPGDPCVDDGLWCNGNDWCNEDFAECMHEFSEADPLCPDDGVFCNGDESCDEDADQCVTSGDPCEGDELFCNGAESCDEDADQCVTSGDPCEDDGEFCNGDESCDEDADQCMSSGDPCEDDESCDEDMDECLTADDDDTDDDTGDDDSSDDDADDDTADDDTADDDANDDDVDADDDSTDDQLPDPDGDDDADDSTGSGCGC